MSPNQARNFRLGVINGTLFSVADSLLDPTLVMVAFLSTLTTSPLLIGLMVPLYNAGWFLPQLYVSTFLQSRPYKKPMYAAMAVVRAGLWLTTALCIALVSNPALLAVLFIGLVSLNELAAGFSGLSFMSVVAKTIPAERRSEFFSWRLSIGGVLSIGAGLLTRVLLAVTSPVAYPRNYLLLFSLAFVCGIFGLLTFLKTDEPPDTEVPPETTLRSQILKARRVLSTDLAYQAFLKMRMALMLAGAATPFFVVWARARYGLPVEWVGVYLVTATTARLLANPLFGWLSRRASNQALLMAASASGLVMVVLMIALAGVGLLWNLTTTFVGLWLIPVFLLYGIREAGIGVTAASLLLDLSPGPRQSLYVGLTHSVLGFTLLATSASGAVVEWAGYVSLFVLALAGNLLAMWYAREMRREAAARQTTNSKLQVPNTQRLT